MKEKELKINIRKNLSYDWNGLICSVPLASDSRKDMEYEVRADKQKEIIDAVVYEIIRYCNQSWWRRLLNLNPPHWIDEWLKKEPKEYMLKPIWYKVKEYRMRIIGFIGNNEMLLL